jgi:cytochrome c-type biogenesis protein CcmH/NrfG
LKQEPDYTKAHYNLGIALAEVGQTSEALQHFQAVLRINPADSNAQAAVSKLLSEKERR